MTTTSKFRNVKTFFRSKQFRLMDLSKLGATNLVVFSI